MEFTDLCRAGTLTVAHRAVDSSWEQATTAVWARGFGGDTLVDLPVLGAGAPLPNEVADVVTAPLWVRRERAPFPRAHDPMDVSPWRILALTAAGLILAVTLLALLTRHVPLTAGQRCRACTIAVTIVATPSRPPAIHSPLAASIRS